MPRGSILLAGWLLLVAGCGHHRPTVYYKPSAAAPITTAPVTTSTPTPPPPPPERVAVTLVGPGPQRVERDALEVLALALRVENVGQGAVDVASVTLRAAGSLDDATGTTTARLAVDQDRDGAYDRAVDRVLASAGFTQDDGALAFTPLPVPLAAGATLDLLVLLDLSGRGESQQEVRLAVSALDARDARGAAAAVDLPAALGPWLRVGAWVTPHEALAVAGEALRPRAVRDAQDRTHVGLFQNLNGTSNVWYSLHDGRSYSPPDNVSRAGRTAWHQDVAVDAAGLPHLVWEEWDLGNNDYVIRHSRFDPAAFAWTPSEVVSTGGGMQINSRVLVGAGGRVDVVWEDWGASSTMPRVAHRRLEAGAWSAVTLVAGQVAAAAEARDPAVAPLPGGDLLVAWVENDAGRAEVRARRLGAAGWGPVEVVAAGAGVLARAELLADGNDVHLLFVDGGEVVHARRTAAGWSQPANVSRSVAPSSEPAMTVWRGALHVAWIESLHGGSHLAYARTQGGGFTAPEVLTLGQGNVSRKYPCLVGEGERLRLLWQDRRLGRQRIFTTWREAGPLEAARAVAATGGDPSRPDVAEDPRGGLHVVWSIDAGGNAEVFHAAEGALDAGFGTPENLSRSAGGSYQPTVAAAAGAVHAAWEEDRGGAFSIVTRTLAGSAWSSPAVVSSATPAYAPRLAGLADGRAALAWTEATAPGDFDVHLSLHDGRAFPRGRAVAPRAGSSAWNPDVALAPTGEVAVAWEEEGARRDVVVAVVTSASTSVAPVASAVAGQYAPRLAWSDGDLWVAWVEDGRARAAVRRAGQATFDAPLELSAGGSWAPDLAAGQGAVVAAWEQWSGQDARVVHATLVAGTTPVALPLDEARGPARRVALCAGPAGGLHAAWSTPGTVWLRTRRAR